MTGIAHLARLWRFLAPYRRRIAGALAALVVAASCVLALGQGLRHVIDAGFGSGEPHLLNAALANSNTRNYCVVRGMGCNLRGRCRLASPLPG